MKIKSLLFSGALFMSPMMGLGSASLWANIAEGTSGGCNYTISDNGVLTISVGEATETCKAGQLPYYRAKTESAAEVVPEWLSNAESITSVVVEDGVKPQTYYAMFRKCLNLTSVDLARFATPTGNPNIYQSMFEGCALLENVVMPVTKEAQQVQSVASMFDGCAALVSVDMSNVTLATDGTNKLVNMSAMFRGCSVLTSIKWPAAFTTAKVTNFSNMFKDCKALTSLDVSMFDGSAAKNLNFMFNNCNKIEELNLANFKVEDPTTNSIFKGMFHLKTLILPAEFVTSGSTSVLGGQSTKYPQSDLKIYVPKESDVTTLNTAVKEAEDAKLLNTYEILTYTQAPSVRTISSEWSTFCYPVEIARPEGLTGYRAQAINGDALTLKELVNTTKFSAGIPIILHKEAEGDVVISLPMITEVFSSETVNEPYSTTNYLKGTYVEKEAAAGTYVLQNQDDVVGFYPVQETKPTVGAFRCWLELPASAAPQSRISFVIGSTTAIEAVEKLDQKQELPLYNLCGQRVAAPKSGEIYLRGNKKVIWK